MTEAPKLKLVDYALQDVPHAEKDEPTLRKVLDRFGPSIARKARQEERAAIFQALGAQNLEECSQLTRVRAERDARPTLEEERKHVKAGYWRGAAQWGMAGLTVGIVGACVLLTFIVVPFNEQTRASTEAGVMVGVAATQQTDRPLGTCTPGARRPDGSVCGETGQ